MASSEKTLSHFDDQGQAHMVDVGAKEFTRRAALAKGSILMKPQTLEVIRGGTAGKGDVLGIARVAAIQAAKKTSDLIPLCHPVSLTAVEVSFEIDAGHTCVHCSVRAESVGQTGVEMEALTACQVALLTIYDMCKGIERGMTISNVGLMEKSGGKSGSWRRTP